MPHSSRVAFDLLKKLSDQKHADMLLHSVISYIKENFENWNDDMQTAATDLFDNNVLKSIDSVTSLYGVADLPATLSELGEYATRLSRVSSDTISQLASVAITWDVLTDTTDAAMAELLAKFERALKTLKERIDGTIQSHADNLVTTVTSYIKTEYMNKAQSLGAITEGEASSIAADIAESTATEIATKIQEKLAEITTEPSGSGE